MSYSLRTTTLLTGILTLGGLVVILAVSFYALVAPHFAALEQQKLTEHCARVQAALQAELTELDRFTHDWSAWDDTYAYVVQRDEAYSQKNLLPASFDALNINLLAMIDTEGRLVYTGAYDTASRRMTVLPESLAACLTNMGPLTRHTCAGTNVTGILSLPEGLLLAASRPIVTSHEQGPIRGALVMGRWLDGALLSNLSARVHVPLEMWRVDRGSEGLPPAARTAYQHLLSEGTNESRETHICCAAGYALLRDIRGTPAALFHTSVVRSVYGEGMRVVRYYLLALMAAGAGVWLMYMLLIERHVVARVARLSAFAREVAARGETSGGVSVGGTDELAQLAADMTHMVEKLHRVRDEERARSQRVAQFSAELVELARRGGDDYGVLRRDIITRTATVLGVARVSFWRFTRDGARIECEELYDAASGAYSSGACLEARAFPAYFQALTTAHLIAADDARGDERTLEFKEAYLVPHGITSMLDAPVRLHGELAGIVCCEHTGAPRVWTLEEQEFVAGIADLMALACEAAERRRIEEMLRENERRLMLAQQFGRIGTWDWDLRSGHDVWSDVAKEIFGVAKDTDEIVFMDFVHPHDRAAVERAVQDCIQRGMPYNIEHRIVRPDGSVRWVAERGNVVRDEQGAPVRMLGLSMDITDRKLAELALGEEKERLAVTLRSIGDGVITTDVQGRVTLMNKVAEQLTGWSQADALGKPVEEVFRVCRADTRAPLAAPAGEVHQAGASTATDETILLVARDGSEHLIVSKRTPIRDYRSMIIGAVIVFSDVTLRRRAEQEMLRAEKLQSIGILAGGIAHDFNNILTVILGNISLARMQAEGNEALEKRLVETEQAITQAMGLTQQLLTFSKGGAPVRKPVNIAELVSNAVRFVCHGTAVRCQFAIARDLWPVIADSGQISQVIHNLVINALQAMNNNGELEVGAENVLIDPSHSKSVRPGRYVRIWVRDHGVGIPREHLARIFDPYFSTKPQGSGLGLAVTYSVIKNHHGHVEVESEPGTGSTFSIFLPAAEEAPEPAPAPPVIAAGGGRILLVDDEEDILTTTGTILRRLGYTVATARDGATAVRAYCEARAAGAPYDAVILDLTVPGGMGGRETLEALRAHDPGVVAIASSGYSNDPVMAHYRAHGFAGVLTKPYTLHELSAAVHAVLQRDGQGAARGGARS